MRFTVIGTDSAGLTLDLVIDARSADEAEYLARERGVNVAKVSLGAESGSGRSARAIAPTPAPNTALAAASDTPVRNASAGPRTDLGIVSLALGGSALLFCWIPVVGVISWPLGAAGAFCGVCGFLGAFRAKPDRPQRSTTARLAVPLGGIGLSAATLLAAGVLAGAAPDERSLLAMPDALGSTPRPAPVAPSIHATDQKPRSLEIVAAAPGPDGFGSNATPAAEVPTLPPANAVLKLGDAELRELSSDVMQIPLIGDQGRLDGLSVKPLLVLRVEVRNVGTGPLEYRTLSGSGLTGARTGSRLKDDRGHSLARAAFGGSIGPMGRVIQETIQPGRSLTDVLVFQRPATISPHYTLSVPGEAVGAAEDGELGVPRPTVR